MITKYNYDIYPKKKPNPHIFEVYEVRFKVNKFSYEVILSTSNKSLAYGMRKKLIKEQPQKYPLNKLIVKKL
jgi:hypothetical protein